MASDYDYLPVSNGNGDAALMHVQNIRITGSTLIDVDTVVNVPAKFVGSYGTLLPTGFLDPTTKVDFKGHVSGADLIIDAFEPGSVDAGNTVGQVVLIKPNTGWANRVAQFVKNMTNFGTPEAITVAAVTAGAVTASSLASSGNTTVGSNLTVTNTSTFNGAISGAGYNPSTMTNPYKFSVHLSASQTGIVDATVTKVAFNTEKFDTNNNFDTSTNLYTVPVTGFYQINAYLQVYSTASTGVSNLMYLAKNGVSIQEGGRLYPVNGSGSVSDLCGNISHLVQLTAGDTLSILVNMDVASGTVTAIGGSTVSSFSGFLVCKT